MRQMGLRLILLVSVLLFSTTALSAAKEEEDIYNKIELFSDALAIIQSEYAEEAASEDLIHGALKGMLSSLDAHSQFLDSDLYNEVKVETEGKFGGLGIVITIKSSLLTIITPIDGTPAYEAGLEAGDKIVKIDGELTKDITLLEAVKKLRGEPGTKVDLTIWREGEEKLLEFTITRDIIEIESIKESKVMEENIGYIRLIEFRETTPEDLDEALASLEEQEIKGLVLDLRNNPGGLLNVAVEVADRFLPSGKLIVSTKGRNPSQNLEFKSRKTKAVRDYPLVVLVNGGSASGSEIVAGAIQDHKRGIVMGTKTFGKGSVQTLFPLKDGSALRLTTGKYFTPSGRSIHGEGIDPDIVVPPLKLPGIQETEGTEEIFEDIEEEKVPEEKEQEEIRDYQLIRAIDLLKGMDILEQNLDEKI